MAASQSKPVYGLLGRKLGHSYSPRIHAMLGDYEYRLHEVEPDDVAAFIREGDFAGLNVTMPYKETVMDLCDKLTDAAKKIGNVNTIVRREDSTLLGDNTDYYGFSHLLNVGHMNVTDRKVVVLGTGGAAKTVHAVLTDRGASEIVMVSRTGENNYENIAHHYDARFIVNTTPVGMFPNCPDSPIDLEPFARTGELREGRSDGLFGVIDVVYNPARTGLMLQAEKLGVPHISGLPMLVAQAKAASELWQHKQIGNEIVNEIVEKITFEEGNIVIIGMPSGGKSTIGSLLAKQLGREFVDIDDYIPEAAGKSIADIFAEDGEEAFRAIETQVTGDVCKRSGLVIACGGGVVTKARNYDLLHQNGIVLLLKRPLELLVSDGRPMSITKGIPALARDRGPKYDAWGDIVVSNDADPMIVVGRALEKLQK